MTKWFENLQTDELDLIPEEIDEEEILFDNAFDNLWINKESWIFKEQMWSFPRLKYRFVVEKWETVASIVKNKILTHYKELDENDRNNWRLVSKIIKEIQEENKIENIDIIKEWSEISVKKRKVSKIVDKYLSENNVWKIEWKIEEDKGYTTIYSIDDFKNSKDPLVKTLYFDKNVKYRIIDELKANKIILIPKYSENEDSKPFDNIDEIIGVSNDEVDTKKCEILKWETFVIDPWHGFNDIWSVWIVRYWDKSLNTEVVIYESAIVMDMAYRVAKLLKEYWANVVMTHYISTRGISEKTMLSPCYTWHDKWTKDVEGSSLARRVKISNFNPNATFISLHINFYKDTSVGKNGKVKAEDWEEYEVPNKEKMAIEVKYTYDESKKNRKASEEFANYLMNNPNWIWYFDKNWNRQPNITQKASEQNLQVCNTNKNTAVLIELFNISNAVQWYEYRSPTIRQKKAEQLVNAIISHNKKQNGK